MDHFNRSDRLSVRSPNLYTLAEIPVRVCKLFESGLDSQQSISNNPRSFRGHDAT